MLSYLNPEKSTAYWGRNGRQDGSQNPKRHNTIVIDLHVCLRFCFHCRWCAKRNCRGPGRPSRLGAAWQGWLI